MPRKLELLAFGFAVALLGLVQSLGMRSTTAMGDTLAWVQHTRKTIEQLDALLIAHVDAETARRGYALTNDETYLEPYRDAVSRAAARLADVRALTADHPRQQERLDALEPNAKTRLAVLEAAVEAQRTHGPGRAGEAQRTAAGKPQMDAVREGIGELIGEEKRLLAEREAQTQARVHEAHLMQMGGTAMSIALIAFAIVRLRREVQARKKSETRARENEQRLATTLHSIGDGVIATDSQGLVQRMNPVAEALTGWTLADARGRSYREVFRLLNDVTGKEAPNPVEGALREGKVVEIDDAAVLIAKDGTRRRVADSAAPIRDAHGGIDGVVLVFHDITRTLEDARVLRRTHAFLDSVFDNIPDMIFVKDAQDLAFVRFNRAGEALLGLSRTDLIGKTDFAFFAPDQARSFVDKDRETLRAKTVVVIEEEPLSTPDGTRWLHTKKVPILDEHGEPEYLLGISRDITDRRRADVQLRASMDATQVAHRELEAFSYSVAHDLRAPLRSIDGFSQALLDDYGASLDANGKDYLLRVRNAARRMAELIDDLLALARVSRSELARSDVDLSALGREVSEQARKLLGAQAEKAEIVVMDGMRVSADARLVRVVLENLLSNALKFSSRRARPEIAIGVQPGAGGQGEVFFVRDNGAGFDVASAKKLFTAFQRYHRPSEYEGSGIGLATSERIVSRHGGRIWAESAPDQGATFFFTLEHGGTTK